MMITINPRFLLDGMLGSLASWLRICGYDSVYYVDMNDDALFISNHDNNEILRYVPRELHFDPGDNSFGGVVQLEEVAALEAEGCGDQVGGDGFA